MNVLVTVGMGPWPFDRLVRAASRLAPRHDVFAQTGTSCVVPNCEFAAYVSPLDVRARIAAADVVVTHAGNTVRLVQRAGKVPIAVAREAARGEMSNDHQVEYLRREEATGRVVALWGSLDGLAGHVAAHARREAEILRRCPAPPIPDLTRAWRLIATALDLDLPRAVPPVGSST